MGFTVGEFVVEISGFGAISPGMSRYSARWSIYRRPASYEDKPIVRGETGTFQSSAEAHAAAERMAVDVVHRLESGEEFPPIDED